MGNQTKFPSVPLVTGLNPPALQQFAQAVRDNINIMNGITGDPLDANVSFRDLVNSGTLSLSYNGVQSSSALGSVSVAPGVKVIGSKGLDYTAPPAPTNLSVAGALGNVILTWDMPTYTNHAYTEIWRRQVTFTAGVADASIIGNSVKIGTSAGYVGVYADSTGAASDCWYWIKFISNASVAGPFNAIAGVRGTTSASPAYLNSLLTGAITSAQLATSLSTPISLITAPASTAGSVAAQVAAEATARAAAIAAEAATRGTAITNEATVRQTATDSLAQSISLITAGVAGGFDPGAIWYFDATVEAWTGTAGTVAWNAGWIDFTATGALPRLSSPTISVIGSQYSTIRARVKRLAGTGWSGSAHYVTAGHGMTDLFHKVIADPALAVGGIAVLEWDMSALTAGGTDWVTNTITQIGFDLGLTSADVFSFDWISVGRNAPGASMAGLSTEQTARISADNANASSITTLSAQVNNATTGLPATLAALNSSIATQATTNTALSSSITALTSTVNTNATNSTSALATEATTRAASDTALSSSISSLSASVTVKNKNFVQGTAPISTTTHTLVSGDLWVDTANGNILKQWTGAAWSPVQDTAILSAANTAANAATIAAGKIVTFVQSTQPVAQTVGDLWIDTGTGNLLKRWSGTAWVAYQDTAIATVSANLSTEQTARATADTALSSSITALTGTVTTNKSISDAALSTEATTRLNADNALSSSITTLTASVSTKNVTYSANTAPINLPQAQLVTGDLWINTASGNQLNRWSGTAWVAVPDAGIAAALAQANTATTNAATAQTTANAAATSSTANASAITTLQTTVAGNTASIATQATSINGLSASYTVKISNNGTLSGYGLTSTLVSGGAATSQFLIAVDQFAVIAPGQTFGSARSVPLAVLTTAQTINGVAFAPGVYLDGSIISNGTITAASIAAGTITADKITTASLSALSANMGSVTAGSMNINNKFIVDSFGNLTANSGRFSGSLSGADITGASGTFGGSLSAGVVDITKLIGTTTNYLTPGTYTLTVPADKTSMRATLVGGGGGGGYSGTCYFNVNPGGGGSAGILSIVTFNGLTPGATYTLTVGAGGGSGASGAATSVSGLISSAGGTAGTSYASNVYAAYNGATVGGDGANGSMGGPSAMAGYGTGAPYYGGTGGAGYGAGGGGGGSGGAGWQYLGAAGGAGAGGMAVIEFFNPNGVVIRSEWNVLQIALSSQGIASTGTPGLPSYINQATYNTLLSRLATFNAQQAALGAPQI